jgi:DNA-binding IclR family transcriptional regulator
VLAHYDGAGVREHFAAHPPRRLTPRTLVTLTAIETALERARRRGYSEDLEEFCEGVCCLAAPFFAGDRAPAGSLSVSVPSFRYRGVRTAVRDAVLDAARAATAALDTARLRVSLG